MFAAVVPGVMTMNPWVAAASIGILGVWALVAYLPSKAIWQLARLSAGLMVALVITGGLLHADRTGLWIGGVWCCDWILEALWICVGEWGPGC